MQRAGQREPGSRPKEGQFRARSNRRADQRGRREQETGDDVAGPVLFRSAERSHPIRLRPEFHRHVAADPGLRQTDGRGGRGRHIERLQHERLSAVDQNRRVLSG